MDLHGPRGSSGTRRRGASASWSPLSYLRALRQNPGHLGGQSRVQEGQGLPRTGVRGQFGGRVEVGLSRTTAPGALRRMACGVPVWPHPCCCWPSRWSTRVGPSRWFKRDGWVQATSRTLTSPLCLPGAGATEDQLPDCTADRGGCRRAPAAAARGGRLSDHTSTNRHIDGLAAATSKFASRPDSQQTRF